MKHKTHIYAGAGRGIKGFSLTSSAFCLLVCRNQKNRIFSAGYQALCFVVCGINRVEVINLYIIFHIQAYLLGAQQIAFGQYIAFVRVRFDLITVVS